MINVALSVHYELLIANYEFRSHGLFDCTFPHFVLC